ncbi:unnamed protein product [Rhizophagus irregularis]|uniref:Uncharacterized protein n=1 Tax=Rhizophagus irregularis TaxID=588596 RepID=A0A916DYB8_9GLOM|nr:unnamed protein product [Rhizophagus irregularis]
MTSDARFIEFLALIISWISSADRGLHLNANTEVFFTNRQKKSFEKLPVYFRYFFGICSISVWYYRYIFGRFGVFGVFDIFGLKNLPSKKFSIACFFNILATKLKKKAITNVYTLKEINNKGHRLGSAYEQELKKKLYTTLSSKAEINDLCEKLLAKNSEYSEREEDIGNKISQLNASSTKVRSQLISERKSHSES